MDTSAVTTKSGLPTRGSLEAPFGQYNSRIGPRVGTGISGAWAAGNLAAVYLIPMALSVASLAVLYSTDLDGKLTDPFFDAATGGFPFRDHWLVGTVLHTFGKYLIIAISAFLLYVSIAGKRSMQLRPWRRSAVYMLTCIAVASAVVGLIKSVSPIPVPWNSVRFGGSTPHYLPFMWPKDAPQSGGWPCAHATGAFALMGTYFVFRDSRPRSESDSIQRT